MKRDSNMLSSVFGLKDLNVGSSKTLYFTFALNLGINNACKGLSLYGNVILFYGYLVFYESIFEWF